MRAEEKIGDNLGGLNVESWKGGKPSKCRELNS